MMLTYDVTGTNIPMLHPPSNQIDLPPYFEGKHQCYFAGKVLRLKPFARRVMTELVRGAPHPVKILLPIGDQSCYDAFRLIQNELRLAKVPWHVRRFKGSKRIALLEVDGYQYLERVQIRCRRRIAAAKRRGAAA
jgi:hypothetical protein